MTLQRCHISTLLSSKTRFSLSFSRKVKSKQLESFWCHKVSIKNSEMIKTCKCGCDKKSRCNFLLNNSCYLQPTFICSIKTVKIPFLLTDERCNTWQECPLHRLTNLFPDLDPQVRLCRHDGMRSSWMPTGADSAEGDGASGHAPPPPHRSGWHHLAHTAKKLKMFKNRTNFRNQLFSPFLLN